MLLAGQIVERDVDGRDGVDAEAAPPRPERSLIELLPKPGRLQRIGADQDFANIAAPQVSGRHLQECLDHMRRRVGLPDAGDACFVGQPDDDGVGRAIQIIRGRGGADDRDDLDGGDLAHDEAPSRWRARR